MRFRQIYLVLPLTLLATLAAISAPFESNKLNANPEKLMTDIRTVDLGEAKSVRVELNLQCGTLKLSGGANKLLEGTFKYNVPEWKPAINYSVSDGRGELIVRQPETHRNITGKTLSVESGGATMSGCVINGGGVIIINNGVITGSNLTDKNDWDLHLASGVPIDLAVNSVAGNTVLVLNGLNPKTINIKAQSGNLSTSLTRANQSLTAVNAECMSGTVLLDLSAECKSLEKINATGASGNLTLRLAGKYPALSKVDVNMSSGNVIIYLDGNWQRNADVKVFVASGNSTVLLPKDTGAMVNVSKALGDLDVKGLSGEGKTYTNAAYGKTPFTLHVNVDVVSGNVNLKVAQ